MDRAGAQRRADRIRAFEAELAEAESTLGPLLDEQPRQRLADYHAATLTQLSADWDIDRTAGQQQLSLGMRVASLVGAIALTASIVLYFYRLWGLIPTTVQLGFLTVLPLLATGLTEGTARSPRTRHFTTITAILAAASMALALIVIGSLYNLPASPLALVAWGGFTLALGLGFGFWPLTVAGTVSLIVGAAGLPLAMTGLGWTPDNGRFERYVVVGLLTIAAPLPWRRSLEMAQAEAIRLAGFGVAALAIMPLSSSAALSLLPFDAAMVQGLYSLLGFLVGISVLWLALRQGWRWTARVAGGFLVLFTYTKAFDWWWELLPGYLFFLVLAAIAVAALVVLQRLRGRAHSEAA